MSFVPNKNKSMSVQSSTVLVSSQNAVPVVLRRSAKFHPSIWGDLFVDYTSDNLSIDVGMERQIEELKAEVRRKLVVDAATGKPSQKLNMIDAVQRLGVAYHFETEVKDALEHIYLTYDRDWNNDDDALYNVALRFRLLRQQGYNVSCDVFNKFKDNKGNFLNSIIGDVRGMLSLYEATHLRVHGEDVLDQALAFCTTHLQSIATQLSSPLATQVVHALKQPIHKGMPRVEAKQYISFYQQEDSHDETLLRLAKLDFNRLQKIHHKELCEITKWWKDLDFATKLPFARDRMVECYFWMLGVYFEPQYYLGRRMLTKVITMTSVMDDITDLYATIEELELFMEGLERWDMSTIDQLPEYMKIYYRALLDIYSELEDDLAKEGRSYRLYYAKQAMKNQARAYFMEAKWSSEKYVPTIEEYLHVASPSSTYPLFTTTSFSRMGDFVTKEAFEWVLNEPNTIVNAASIIGRILNDLVSHEFEQKREHVASAVECYMKQHGVSKQEAHEELQKQVTNAWKDINQECLKPTMAIPMTLLTQVLNLARVSYVVYRDGDGYTNSNLLLKDYIVSLLIDPIAI
ncbi:hypothetical protein L1049_027383 [Liquidambar formosana]|uniref:Uncharacterized protein n=1 Tax=Liquidambar formosana TaxID=63359 RepID=A0AAP0RHA4_LIQFO